MGILSHNCPVPYIPKKASVTLKFKEGYHDRVDFDRKIRALQDAAERGKLYRMPNPVKRNQSYTSKYRRRLQKKIKEKYADNPKMRDRLLVRLEKMDVDHQIDLQVAGLDDSVDMWMLHSETNRDLGWQLYQQLKKLEDYTQIVEIIVE